MFPRPTAGLVASLSISFLLASVTAFDVDKASCSGDKEAYIKNAVADAQKMATKGKEAVFANQYGNSREKIWMTTDLQVLREVETYLQAVLDFPDLFEYKPGSSPLFYCGSKGFEKQPNGEFMDKNTGLTLKPKGNPNSLERTTGDPHLGTTYRGSKKIPNNPGGLHSVVILHQGAPGGTGVSPDTAANVATLADVMNQQADPVKPNRPPGNGVKGFYNGKNLDRIVGYWLTSFVILHEYIHVVQPIEITSGSDEIYGWSRCTGTSKTGRTVVKDFAAAIVNADSYAYWCLSAYVESETEYTVLQGELFHPPTIGGITERRTIGDRESENRTIASTFTA